MLIKSIDKVEKLTKRVEQFYEQKEKQEQLDERQKARLKLINESPEWTKTDFWCHKHGDTTGMAYKVVFEADGEWYAFYQSTNSRWPKDLIACCKGLRRYITDKNQDPYYRDSKMIQKQRREAEASGDFLQPGDVGFITKYGDSLFRKKWEKMEQEERANFRKKIMV